MDKFKTPGLKKIFRHQEIKNKLKVILIHLHFKPVERRVKSNLLANLENYSLKLAKRKKILQLFRDIGVELLLHGHTPESGHYQRKGIPLVNIGGSIKSEQRGNLHLNFAAIKNNRLEVAIKRTAQSKFRLNASYQLQPKILSSSIFTPGASHERS